jgi:vacuolar-type H+-ATPase subunit I/STV1
MKEHGMNLETLRNLFPKTRRNYALTGWIPMEFFEDNEEVIRKAVRDLPGTHRYYYRGPRINNKPVFRSNKPSMTRRCDATHVTIYLR